MKKPEKKQAKGLSDAELIEKYEVGKIDFEKFVKKLMKSPKGKLIQAKKKL